MSPRKSAASFFVRPTRICTKCGSLHSATSLFTARDNVPISRFISSRARFALANRVISSGDGTTRRDYTYIDDIIQGTVAALKYDGPMFDVFNLGESETIQLKDLIAAIENTLGKKAKINRLPEQPGDMRLTCADISKARKLLGYDPKTKFEDGLPRFVDWFLKSRGAK